MTLKDIHPGQFFQFQHDIDVQKEFPHISITTYLCLDDDFYKRIATTITGKITVITTDDDLCQEKVVLCEEPTFKHAADHSELNAVDS